MTSMEFDDKNPLVVVIAEVNEGKSDWDIQVDRKYGEEMRNRIKIIEQEQEAKANLGEVWLKKRVKTAVMDRQMKDLPDEPHFLHPEHRPIVVHTGETVLFTCKRPFKIWAYREPRVKPDLRSPENPFGWEKTREAEKKVEAEPWKVQATAVEGLKAQRFYKCTAWVQVDGETVLVDPDCIGD